MSTYLGFIQPAYNAFFLMMLCIPAVLMMVFNLKKEESDRVTSLGRRSIGSPVHVQSAHASDLFLFQQSIAPDFR